PRVSGGVERGPAGEVVGLISPGLRALIYPPPTPPPLSLPPPPRTHGCGCGRGVAGGRRGYGASAPRRGGGRGGRVRGAGPWSGLPHVRGDGRPGGEAEAAALRRGDPAQKQPEAPVQERSADFPPSKLKSGHGEHVCYVLDCLAEEALKYVGFSWKRPVYPVEELEEETVPEDDAELTVNKVDEEIVEEETDNEENFIDLNVLKAQTYRLDMNESAKQEDILESTTDAAEWNLEVERVLPQLKVTIRTDNKDWRIHVDQMHQHKGEIESALKETKGFLDKLHNEISRTLEKISSREKYINNQLEHLIQEYRAAQAQLSEARERYQQGNGGVTERTRILSEITEELEKVKQEMEEKGSSMTDGAPLVKIKQSLTKLKQETVQMDIRIGVVEHTLLQSKLKEKSNMTRDMHATIIPESAVGSY
uniref:Intraflagellar transport protein 57 homolog n=1 Tax=Vombatus ursinus TaxID=29139 RepID=A0A4X2L7H1_VOMUR